MTAPDRELEYLHTLLNEVPLRNFKFLVFLNFKEGEGDVLTDEIVDVAKAKAMAKDGLQIAHPFNIFITNSIADLKTAMEVEKVDPRGCFCP